METVELGPIRVHVLRAAPGLPGDADRICGVLRAVDPAAILVDMDTDECLRMLESMGRERKPYALSYVDGLLREEMVRRFAQPGAPKEHPLQAAARHARSKHVAFIPLRPPVGDPGWLARRRGRNAVIELPDALTADAFPDAFAAGMAEARVWRASDDAESARPRLERALSEGRAPVVVLVQAHRHAAYRNMMSTLRRVAA